MITPSTPTLSKPQVTAPVDIEQDFVNSGYTYIVGIDEVGRGALAGAAYIGYALSYFTPTYTPELLSTVLSGVNDSKKLSPKRRENFTHLISSGLTNVGYVKIDVSEIDDVGVDEAIRRSVQTAFDNVRENVYNLRSQPSHSHLPEITKENCVIITDQGLQNVAIKEQGYASYEFVHGDSRSLLIACASVFAKTHRDRYMTLLHNQHPEYGWKSNKGYGTKQHTEALKTHGVTKLHRMSFEPMKSDFK